MLWKIGYSKIPLSWCYSSLYNSFVRSVLAWRIFPITTNSSLSVLIQLHTPPTWSGDHTYHLPFFCFHLFQETCDNILDIRYLFWNKIHSTIWCLQYPLFSVIGGILSSFTWFYRWSITSVVCIITRNQPIGSILWSIMTLVILDFHFTMSLSNLF